MCNKAFVVKVWRAVAKDDSSRTYLIRSEKARQSEEATGEWVITELAPGTSYSCDMCQELVTYPHECYGPLY